MKIILAVSLILSLFCSTLFSQIPTPDLSAIDTVNQWVIRNRDFTIDEGVHLNAQQGDGLLWLKNNSFENGTIEVDLKGKNEPGKSFVGIAFHGLNDSVFDAVYFRAFNFKNSERSNHSVQYIAHPENTWHSLRAAFLEKYESTINPVPEPNDWFHVKLEVEFPNVRVFVNDAEQASLSIHQLSIRKKGWVGFWVGNNSEGSFRNLKISE